MNQVVKCLPSKCEALSSKAHIVGEKKQISKLLFCNESRFLLLHSYCHFAVHYTKEQRSVPLNIQNAFTLRLSNHIYTPGQIFFV
jgi:hypothetical protein